MMRYIETLRVEQGQVCHVHSHIERIRCTIGRTLPLDELPIPAIYQQGRVKLRVLYSLEKGIEEVSFQVYETPVIRTLRCVTCNDMVYDRKMEDRSLLNVLHDLREGCDDVLIVREGLITDTTFCNIVFQKGTFLYTPLHPLLEGTCRSRLLQQGVLQLRNITPQDSKDYEKAYLINAMIDLGEVEVSINNIVMD